MINVAYIAAIEGADAEGRQRFDVDLERIVRDDERRRRFLPVLTEPDERGKRHATKRVGRSTGTSQLMAAFGKQRGR